ncbi:MAG: ABC transporter ATP-binding protein [Phyllobacterium sp.]
MSVPFLSIRDLTVSYGGRAVLENVSLDVEKGGRLALIGESGSGKSTLAMAVAGLLPKAARQTGEIVFPAMSSAPTLGKDIGIVFQDPNGSLDPVMRVGDQIAEVIVEHLGWTWIAARVRAAELMDRVRIPDALLRLNSFPHEFSGGQKQRIALAAALAANPAFIIADELTSALDTVVQKHVADLLDRLVREDGLTLLFVTHDIALASQLAGHIAVLYKGRLVEHGPAAQVLSRPKHAYTKALIATHLSLDSPRRTRLPEIDATTLKVR